MRIALLLSVALAATVSAQTNPHATRVVTFDDKGGLGGGIFDPTHALGVPNGAFDVHSLGIGGHIVLGFDVTITDGPGADFIVSENAFFSGGIGETFAEMMFVEVSSNGADFARVPNGYYGLDVWPGPFGVISVASYGGLAGAVPVNLGAADPQDLVSAGGDGIDLADLRGHPLVVSGKVDLAAISQVRLVDVVDGVDRDSRGRVVRDSGAGSADVDAVTVIQHQGNQDPRGPRIDLQIPADGNYELTLSDPDGLSDLDLASWRMALWGIPISPAVIVTISQISNVTGTSITMRLGGPLPAGFLLQMATSIKDRAGNRSSAMRARPAR